MRRQCQDKCWVKVFNTKAVSVQNCAGCHKHNNATITRNKRYKSYNIWFMPLVLRKTHIKKKIRYGQCTHIFTELFRNLKLFCACVWIKVKIFLLVFFCFFFLFFHCLLTLFLVPNYFRDYFISSYSFPSCSLTKSFKTPFKHFRPQYAIY